MPRLSPSAWRSASPSASAQSSTVWCSSTCRSPLQSSVQREAAVLGQLLQHVVEEADAGADADRALGIQVDADADAGFPGLRATAARGAPAAACAMRGPGFRRRTAGLTRKPAHAEVARRTRCPCRGRRSRRCAPRSIGVRGEVVAQQAGLRLAAVAAVRRRGAGRCRRASKRMPWEAKTSQHEVLGRSKSAAGNAGVPRPSWLVTITKS